MTYVRRSFQLTLICAEKVRATMSTDISINVLVE